MFNQKILTFSAIAIISFTILSSCNNSFQAKTQTTIKKEILTDIAAITQNVETYLNRSVLVRNDIIETVGNQGIILDKDRVFSGATILVISTSQIPAIDLTNKTPEVLLRGTVQQLNLTKVKQEYGLNLDPSLYGKYEGKPVIIATSIILSPDPEDTTNYPEDYYGKYLAIKGEVEDVEDFGIFELDEEQAFGGEDLLVLQVKPKIKLKEEQMVIVYGVLRPFNLDELEKNYDLDWDVSIKEKVEVEYAQKPVFIGQKIIVLSSY